MKNQATTDRLLELMLYHRLLITGNPGVHKLPYDEWKSNERTSKKYFVRIHKYRVTNVLLVNS